MPNVGKGKKFTRPSSPKPKKAAYHDDDMPLDASAAPEEDNEVTHESVAAAELATPFEDGLVHREFNNLPRVSRVGGEETIVLRNFLSLFSKTDTFIGAIYSKTSFMKKTGGRLL